MLTSNGRSDGKRDFSAAKSFFSNLLIEQPPLPQCQVSVTIPVRDEAENLAKTLRSVVNQIDFKNRQLNPHLFEIIVLANNCTDNSVVVVRKFQNQTGAPPIHVVETTLPPELANVGTARRIVMDEACARLTRGGCGENFDKVIATTDGDTTVAPTWIAATLREIGRGAEAVSGRISIDAHELAALDRETRRFHLLDVGYRSAVAELESVLDPLAHDPFPRHHQHFNASFAVTTAAYRRAGGIPPVPFLEDFAFYQALLRIDARFRHSPLVRVNTSSRRRGRTAGGLSTLLAEWEAMGAARAKYLVASLAEIETKFKARRLLRAVWRSARLGFAPDFWELDALADEYRVERHFLSDEILRLPTFGALCERVGTQTEKTWRERFALVPVERALADLRQKLAPMRAARYAQFIARKHRADNFPRVPPERVLAARASNF